MSDANLLAYGCAVSFFALAGIYVYVRESFTDQTRSPKGEQEPEQTKSDDLQDVA